MSYIFFMNIWSSITLYVGETFYDDFCLLEGGNLKEGVGSETQSTCGFGVEKILRWWKTERTFIFFTVVVDKIQ